MVGVQATPTIPHSLCTSAFHPYDGRRLENNSFMPVDRQVLLRYQNTNEKLSALLRQISWTNNLTIMSRSETS
jgi:hypothetical protein